MTRWLQVHEAAAPAAGERPAYLLRREFELPAQPVRAVLRVSARGLYEGHVNGVRMSADVLTPGYTEYLHRVQVQTYDLAPLLQEGQNALAFLLADGWYRGKVGIGQLVDNYGDRVALHVDLRIECADGTLVEVGADDAWRAGPSHIVSADLFDGQIEDRRLLDRAPYDAGFDDSGWAAPEIVEGGPNLVDPVAPPVRRIEEIVPVSEIGRAHV